MTTKHPADEEIQQYVLEGTAIVSGIAAHIDSCELCQARADAYRRLITAIEHQPAPAFDFDIAELVLAQVALPKTKKIGDRSLAWIFIVAGLSFSGILIYLFRYDLPDIFEGITALFTYIIIITGMVLLTGLSIDMYKTYRKKMNTLDIS